MSVFDEQTTIHITMEVRYRVRDLRKDWITIGRGNRIDSYRWMPQGLDLEDQVGSGRDQKDEGRNLGMDS